MQRRIGISFVVSVIIIVIAAAVAPYFVGRAAESSFKARIADINAHHPGVIVQVDSYQRGFYSSEVKLSLTPQAGMAPRALRLWSIMLGSRGKPQFNLHIDHGPIPFAAFGNGHMSFLPVLYSAEFRGDKLPPSSILGIFKPDVYIRQYFTGGTRSTLSVPPGRYSLGVFGATWQGGQVTAGLNSTQNRVHYNGSIGMIQYQTRNVRNANSYSGSLQGFNFSGDKHRVKYDFWTGTSRSTFKGAEFKLNGKQVAKLAAGQGHSEQNATADGRWLGGSSAFVQQGGTLKGWPYAKLTLNESVSHIDAATLRRFLDQFNTAERTVDSGVERDALRQTLPVLGRALAPAQATARLAFVAPDGRLNIGARVTFAAAVPIATVSRPFALLDRINARATLDFDRKLVDGFSTRVLGSNAVQTVDRVFDQWRQEGYLKTGSDGREHSVLTYRSGVFAINGQVIYSASDTGKPQLPSGQ